jgi:short chain dehydrogenase
MGADLSGSAALITGAASGIGRASALAFASAGASVALVDIDAEGLADAAAAARAVGARAEVLVADVRDLRAVTGAVGRAVEAFGRLDAALNNAGVPGPYVPRPGGTRPAWRSRSRCSGAARPRRPASRNPRGPTRRSGPNSAADRWPSVKPNGRPRSACYGRARTNGYSTMRSEGAAAPVGAEYLRHQAILMNHAPGAVTPLNPEMVQVGDAVG